MVSCFGFVVPNPKLLLLLPIALPLLSPSLLHSGLFIHLSPLMSSLFLFSFFFLSFFSFLFPPSCFSSFSPSLCSLCHNHAFIFRCATTTVIFCSFPSSTCNQSHSRYHRPCYLWHWHYRPLSQMGAMLRICAVKWFRNNILTVALIHFLFIYSSLQSLVIFYLPLFIFTNSPGHVLLLLQWITVF